MYVLDPDAGTVWKVVNGIRLIGNWVRAWNWKFVSRIQGRNVSMGMRTSFPEAKEFYILLSKFELIS